MDPLRLQNTPFLWKCAWLVWFRDHIGAQDILKMSFSIFRYFKINGYFGKDGQFDLGGRKYLFFRLGDHKSEMLSAEIICDFLSHQCSSKNLLNRNRIQNSTHFLHLIWRCFQNHNRQTVCFVKLSIDMVLHYIHVAETVLCWMFYVLLSE